MVLESIDWWLLATYFAVSLGIGAWAARRAGASPEDFFLAGRSRPWWLLGLSMVATTFSTDTPNLVTDITRQHGVGGNWVWWAFLLTGMLTATVYARLWRRSGVTTDMEFYELRYSGRPAAFLRGFRALYLGVFFNVMIMAAVTLAAIKIGGVMFGASPLTTVAVAGGITVLYSAAGGLSAVLATDALLFFVAMAGSVAAAVVALSQPEVGGLSGLLAHPAVSSRLDLVPDLGDPNVYVPLFLVPLAVQWWASWYPGSEPGGGGYVAQRMLAARDERHAAGATLFFNVAHYALRPWPWVLVALASLVIFPDLDSLRAAFPQIDPAVVGNDLAYPAMLTLLPAGLLGLVVASLAAAYMSTISSHLNWGSSYLVHDFYRRFVRPDASQREQVLVGRLATVGLMGVAAALALMLSNALQAFQILLQIGAGTGLLFLLRWFWWRINAWSELAAMGSSFLVALGFWLDHRRRAEAALDLVASGMDRLAAEAEVAGLEAWQELLVGVAVTTVCWIVVTFVTPPTRREALLAFCDRVRPGGPGWRAVVGAAGEGEGWPLPGGILAAMAGSMGVYGALFAGGLALFSRPGAALVAALVAALGGVGLVRWWPRSRPPGKG